MKHSLVERHAQRHRSPILLQRVEDRSPAAVRLEDRPVRADEDVRLEHLARIQRHRGPFFMWNDARGHAHAELGAVFARGLGEDEAQVGVLRRARGVSVRRVGYARRG